MTSVVQNVAGIPAAPGPNCMPVDSFLESLSLMARCLTYGFDAFDAEVLEVMIVDDPAVAIVPAPALCSPAHADGS